MPHVKTQIRQRATDLLAGMTLADGTTPLPVFASRTYPVDESDMPCVTLYTPDVQVTEHFLRNPGRRILRLAVTLRIVVFYSMPSSLQNTLEDDLDAIALQVCNRIGTGFGMGADEAPVAILANLVGDRSATVTDTSQSLVMSVLTYSVLVDVLESDLSVAVHMQRR